MRIELATTLMFLVLLAAAVVGYEPLRTAAADGARNALDSVFPASWAGYYLELDDTAPAAGDAEERPSRLMFATGALPGSAARLLEDRVYSGTWSPAGDRFVVSSGSRLFLGDHHGQVRQLADLGDLLPTAPAVWASERELLLAATRDGARQWLVRLDARTGTVLDQRDMPLGLQPYAPSPDGRWLLAFDQRGGSGVLGEQGPRTIWLIAAGETPVRAAKDLGRVYLPVPSRDGRFVSFSEVTAGADRATVRTGVIEVATRRVAYACAEGCAALELR